MARLFAGGAATDNVLVANAAAINSLSAYTVAYRAKLNAIDATSRRLVDKIGAATPGAALFDHVVVTGLFRVRDYLWNTTGGIWTCAPPSTGVWHTIVVTYDGSNVANVPVIEFDGVGQTVSTSVAPVGSRASETLDLYLGNASTIDRCLDGALAEFSMWNRVLTAGEIAAFHQSFAPGFFRNGLVCYPPLIGRLSPELNLATGGGGTGTVTGTTTVEHPRTIYPIGLSLPAQDSTPAPTGSPFTMRQSTVRGGDVLRGAVAGATTFDAAVTLSVVSSGALTTQIVCAGAAAVSVLSAGALTTSIRCAGAVAVSITASGSLTTAITCSAAVTVSLTTSGALTTQIVCAGAVALSVTSTGSLTTAIRCAAAVSCTLVSTGDLTTASRFSAAVTGSLLAAGALTTQIVCAGTAAVSIVASGSLTTAIQCAAAASGSIVASGSLTTGLRLVASSTGTINASGVLSTSIWMAATPAGTLSTTGMLSTQILLVSSVICALDSSASLSTGAAFGVPVLVYVRVTQGLARQLACAGMFQREASVSAVSMRIARVTPMRIQPASVSQEITRHVTV